MKSVEVSFEKSEATDYVLEILSLGICSLFFPMSFVQEQGKLTGCCETEGFRCLTSFTELGTGDILHIASAILRGAGQAEERYIFSELYQIEPCCVYVDKTFVQVKLVFQPARQQKRSAVFPSSAGTGPAGFARSRPGVQNRRWHASSRHRTGGPARTARPV